MLLHLALPLFRHRRRRGDDDGADTRSGDQFADYETGLDGLPGSRVIGDGEMDAREAERLAKRLRLAGLDPDPGWQRSLEERWIGRGRAIPAQRIQERGDVLRRIEPPVAGPRTGFVVGNRTISPDNMEAAPILRWHANSGSAVRPRLALAGPLVRTRRAGYGIRRLPAARWHPAAPAGVGEVPGRGSPRCGPFPPIRIREQMQQLKVFILMAGLTALLVVLGGWLGGQQGAVLFLVIAAVMNFGMFWFSDRAVLRMYRARIIGPDDAPHLYRMVDDLRRRAGLPMPTLAIADKDQPNAFATGRSHKKAVVCVTTGLLRLVNTRELEGVVAHELAHIRHNHMLVSTVAATMAGAIGLLASVARWGAILGGGRGSDRNIFELLLMSIIAPLAAMIVQMAISRANEYQADRTGARIAGRADGLANALHKLERYSRQLPMDVNPAAAQLAIVNPLAGIRGGGLTGLFRTHPPTEDRIARLRQLRDL